MNYRLHSLLRRFGQIVPFSAIRGLVGRGPITAMYHGVAHETPIHIKHLFKIRNIETFRSDLDTFLRFYDPICVREFLKCIGNKEPLPSNTFLVSFDDGLREAYEVAAHILREKGVPAVFFLTSGFLDNRRLFYRHKVSILVEKYIRVQDTKCRHWVNDLLPGSGVDHRSFKSSLMGFDGQHESTLDQLAEVLGVDFDEYLAQQQPYMQTWQVRKLIEWGFEIGSHSDTHPRYDRIPLDEQVNQTARGMKALRDQFNLDYRVFSFPFGDWGIEESFYQRVFENGFIQACFSSRGAHGHSDPRRIRTVPMEGRADSAERILRSECMRRIKRILGANPQIAGSSVLWPCLDLVDRM